MSGRMRCKYSPAQRPSAERTRLHVQRHRDQQHLVRAQQIVQNVAVTQELLPTVEFSALTLRDDSTHHLLPSKSSLGRVTDQTTNLGPRPSLRQLPSPHLQLLRPFISRMTMPMTPRAPCLMLMPGHNRRPQHHHRPGFLGKMVGHLTREVLWKRNYYMMTLQVHD
ncbi:hypothetical protein EDB80DRAFT_783629 [Ilyonectria destructans]|nr:hypothetical protein EDB80DRAFT_783629 [Ilyonectria destructans]